MHLIIGAFVVLLVVMFFVAYAITMAFDEKELPKIVGAAFGASFSAAVAILLFYLSRARDEERSQSESLKFQKAHWQEIWAMMPSVYQELIYWRANSGEQPMPANDHNDVHLLNSKQIKPRCPKRVE
jgi:ABC-type Fe3+-siderophore transport system permease subunit